MCGGCVWVSVITPCCRTFTLFPITSSCMFTALNARRVHFQKGPGAATAAHGSPPTPSALVSAAGPAV